MFTPFYLHPLFDTKECEKYRERWSDAETRKENSCYERVISLIKDGAGKHFLNYDFYNGSLPTLEDDLDLKGIKFWKLEIDFDGHGDCFKGINFKYAEMWHIHFKNAVFYSCSFSFTKLYNCTFENCDFAFAGFLGAKLEKCKFINCEFVEYSTFENVMLLDCSFSSCFLGKMTPFRECYFDDLTLFTDNQKHSDHFGEKYPMLPAAHAGLYSSFQMAYQASGSEELATEFYWKARQAFTRYNQKGFKQFVAYINELTTGYGLKPLRPLIVMFLVNLIGSFGFSNFMPLKDSIPFTAGAFFTFGGMAQHLDEFGILGRLVYVAFSFLGIILSGLFVTTLANLWFRSNVPNQTINTEK